MFPRSAKRFLEKNMLSRELQSALESEASNALDASRAGSLSAADDRRAQ